jgi:hypothetical protein
MFGLVLDLFQRGFPAGLYVGVAFHPQLPKARS